MDQKLEDLIGKDIRFKDPNDTMEPMKWKIIAVDIHGRLICEYDELPWDVFCDSTVDQLMFEEPKPIPDEIEVDWIKYKRIF